MINYAHIAASTSDGLTIVDISNTSSLTKVGSLCAPGGNMDGAHAFDASGNFGFVLSPTKRRLTIIDVSNATSPTEVASLQHVRFFDVARGRHRHLRLCGGSPLCDCGRCD